MFGPLLGSAASSAFGALSSALQNKGERKNMRLANRLNIKLWNKQNEYNHPLAQMDRLKTAGLNPNLIYGTSPTSAVGNADKIAPVSKPDYKMDIPSPMVGAIQAAQFRNTQAQTDNYKAQNEVLVQDAVLKAAQAAHEVTKDARSKFDLGLAQELRTNSLEVAKAHLENLQHDAYRKQIENSHLEDYQKRGLEKIAQEILMLKATTRNLGARTAGQYLQNRVSKFKADLAAIGLSESDPVVLRILGGAVIPNAQKILDTTKGLWSNIKENWFGTQMYR